MKVLDLARPMAVDELSERTEHYGTTGRIGAACDPDLVVDFLAPVRKSTVPCG